MHCWVLSCTFLLIKSVTEISKGDEYFLTYLWRYCCLVAQLFCLFCDPMNYSPTRLLRPWSSPGKNTGVAYYVLCQGFFLTQGLNTHLLHGRQILHHRATREAFMQMLLCCAQSCLTPHDPVEMDII